MKKLLVVLFALILLAGCSTPSSSNGSNGSATVGSSSGSGEGEGTDLNSTNASIYDFAVSIDGVEYTLPIALSEVLENGWGLEESVLDKHGEKMLSDTTMINYIYLVKGDWKIEIVLENLTGEEATIEELSIIELTFETVNEYPEVVLAEGITLNSTLNDVLTAFGQYSEASEETFYYSVRYVENDDFLNGGRYQFAFPSSEMTEQIQRVIIRNK